MKTNLFTEQEEKRISEILKEIYEFLSKPEVKQGTGKPHKQIFIKDYLNLTPQTK